MTAQSTAKARASTRNRLRPRPRKPDDGGEMGRAGDEGQVKTPAINAGSASEASITSRLVPMPPKRCRDRAGQGEEETGEGRAARRHASTIPPTRRTSGRRRRSAPARRRPQAVTKTR